MGGFDELLRKAGVELSDAPVEASTPQSQGEAPTGDPQFAPKVVLRYTKKGRGGKPVTLVQGVQSGQKALCKTLKKKLGTGAKVEGSDIAVQGDQRERIKPMLEAMGAKQIVLS